MLGCYSWIVYTVRERKHCPRTQFLTKKNRRHWLSLQFSFSPSLYVFLQQWARPHIRRSGRSPWWPRLFCFRATTLLSYQPLLSFLTTDFWSPFPSSPLASSKSFFQSSNAVPFLSLHHLHKSSSINASRHAQSCTHHTT
jgi:hypothetical protein